MNTLVGRILIVAAGSLLPMATVAGMTPAVSAADIPNCENGWWDPVIDGCRPAVATTPLACDNGWWWDPVNNVCAPPVLPPQ